MKKYYLDLNSVKQKPVILYDSNNEAGGVNDWEAETCWKRLIDNSSAPLENLILCITNDEMERLRLKSQERTVRATVADELVNEMISALSGHNRSLLDTLAKEGVHDHKGLSALVAKHKKRLDGLDLDNELMIGSDVYDEDLAPIAQLTQKVAVGAPGQEIVDFINEKVINRYFPDAWEKMPAAYDQARIAEIVNNVLPGRIAFTNFYGEFVQACRNRFKAIEEKLAEPVFHKKETYGRFPGIAVVKCRVASEGLPTVDMGESFDWAAVNTNLSDHPGGFIVAANQHHYERVVLPHDENIKLLDHGENYR